MDTKEVLAQRHVGFAWWLVIDVAVMAVNSGSGSSRALYTESAGDMIASQSKASGNIFTLVLDAEAQLMRMCNQL